MAWPIEVKWYLNGQVLQGIPLFSRKATASIPVDRPQPKPFLAVLFILEDLQIHSLLCFELFQRS